MIEYSEMDQTMASVINQETGRLRYCWSNVCFNLSYISVLFNSL